mgnify:CR=1 FL=1
MVAPPGARHNIGLMIRALLLAVLFLVGAAHAEPSDEMFEKLRTAPSDSEANDVAMDIWASWMESGSPTVDVIMERGVDAQTAGDFETARAFFDRAILIKPDYPEANETLQLEPRHFGAWSGLGMMFESMGSPKHALEAYREAIEIYPRMQQALAAEKRLSKLAEGQGL